MLSPLSRESAFLMSAISVHLTSSSPILRIHNMASSVRGQCPAFRPNMAFAVNLVFDIKNRLVMHGTLCSIICVCVLPWCDLRDKMDVKGQETINYPLLSALDYLCIWSRSCVYFCWRIWMLPVFIYTVRDALISSFCSLPCHCCPSRFCAAFKML